MRDPEDMIGTKYTYCNGSNLILLLIKSILVTFPLLINCLIYVQIWRQKIKLYVVHIY